MADRDELLDRIDTTVDQVLSLIDQARQLPLPPAAPLRRPVLEALEAQIQIARQYLRGEYVDRRHGYGRRASDRP